MAIIYTYPSATPKATDKLIGTVTEDNNAVNVVKGNPTRSFTISALQSLFNEDVVSSTIKVPSASLLAIDNTGSTSVTLLTAPAAGTAYDIQQLTAYMNVGSSAYLSGAALHIKGPWSATTVVVPQAFINTSTVTGDSLYKIAELNNLAGYTMAQATALTLNSGSGTKFTTGNGILYINITYKIINTTATMV